MSVYCLRVSFIPETCGGTGVNHFQPTLEHMTFCMLFVFYQPKGGAVNWSISCWRWTECCGQWYIWTILCKMCLWISVLELYLYLSVYILHLHHLSICLCMYTIAFRLSIWSRNWKGIVYIQNTLLICLMCQLNRIWVFFYQNIQGLVIIRDVSTAVRAASELAPKLLWTSSIHNIYVTGDAIHPKEQLLVCQKKFWTITWTQTSYFIIYNLRFSLFLFLPGFVEPGCFDVTHTGGRYSHISAHLHLGSLGFSSWQPHIQFIYQSILLLLVFWIVTLEFGIKDS